MRQKSKYVNALRDELIRLGLYQDRNERLIAAAGLNSWLIAEMEDSLRRQSFELRQIGSMGQQKVQMHPFVEQLRKLSAQNAYIYGLLGMGNRDGVDTPQEDEMQNFLQSILQ